MRKILTILLLLVSFSGMAQQTFKRQEIIADTLRGKNLSAAPDSMLGYWTVFGKGDSLWFMDQNETTYNLLDWIDNYVKRNGTTPLTGDWDAGAFKIENQDTISTSVLQVTGNSWMDGTLRIGATDGFGSRHPLEIVYDDAGIAITSSNTAAGSESYVAGFIKDASLDYQKVGAMAFQWTDNNVTNGYASWNVHTTYWEGGDTYDHLDLVTYGKKGATFFPVDLTSTYAPGDNILRVIGNLKISGSRTYSAYQLDLTGGGNDILGTGDDRYQFHIGNGTINRYFGVDSLTAVGWELMGGPSSAFAWITSAGGAPSVHVERFRVDSSGAVTPYQFTSTVATGTSPLNVVSTTLVDSLNADFLDGHHASYFQTALTNPVTGTGVATYLTEWTAAGTVDSTYIIHSGNKFGFNISPVSKYDFNGSSFTTSYATSSGLRAHDNIYGVNIGGRDASSVGVIQGSAYGVGAGNILIQPNGGYTGVGGWITPGVALDVNGTVRSRTGNISLHDGSTLGGGLYFYKTVTGGGSSLAPSLYANTGNALYFMVNGSSTPKAMLSSGGKFNINDVSNTTYDLYVNGTAKAVTSFETPVIKITTGAADGYYLKSDADGDASWAALAASQVYKGTFDGSTGYYNAVPDSLIDGTGTAGWYYRCVVAGTHDYGNPSGNSITFAVGDDAYYNGTVWQKIPGQGYTLQAMTASVLGGAKLGNSLQINSEVLDVNNGDNGDIDITGTGTDVGKIWTVDTAAITYLKMQNVSAQWKVLGRSSSGAGVVEELSMSGTGDLLGDISPVVKDSIRVDSVAFGTAWINSTAASTRGELYTVIKPLQDSSLSYNDRINEISGDTANFLLRDGTRPLTADWAAGAHKISNTDTIQGSVLRSTGNGIIGNQLSVGITSGSATITAGGSDPKIVLGTAVPNTWFTSTYDVGVIQSGIGTWASRQDQAAGNALSVGNNIYLGTDSDYHYMIADEATRYSQINGTHVFRTAPVGVPDATISWITALTLSATGQAAFVDSVTVANRDYNHNTWIGSYRVPTSWAIDKQFVKVQDSLTDHSGRILGLEGGSASRALDNLSAVAINTALLPGTSNTIALGSAAYSWSDQFLGSGSFINWDNGDVTLEHSANLLTLAGGSFNLGAGNLYMTGSLGITGSRVTKGWFTDLEITNTPTINGVSMSPTNWDAAYSHSTTTTGSIHGSTTVGGNLFRLTNPGAITFLRVNANNSVSALSATDFRTATGSGTVTSVDLTVPIGLTVLGGPITGSGTLAVSLQSGYSIPSTAYQNTWNLAYTHKTTEDSLNGLVKVDGAGGYSAITDNSTNWNTAYGWGNWASNFGTTAGTIAQGNDSRITNGQTAYGWGNHASVGYALTSGKLSQFAATTSAQFAGVISDEVGLGKVVLDSATTFKGLTTIQSTREGQRIQAVDQSVVVCDGDSRTVGYTGGTAYPYSDHLTLDATYTIYNTGNGGATLTYYSGVDWKADLAYQNVDKYLNNVGVQNIVVIWAGVNDMYVNDVNENVAYRAIKSYCEQRRQKGWKVIVCTEINCTDATIDDTRRVSFNTLVRNNWASFADYLCDLGNTSPFNTATSHENTTYYLVDGVHLTAAGYQLIANAVSTSITNFVATTKTEIKSILLQIFDPSADVVAGTDKAQISIPYGLEGWKIIKVEGHSYVAAGGDIIIQIKRSSNPELMIWSDVLSSRLYVKNAYYDSKSYYDPTDGPTEINPTYSTMHEGYVLAVDITYSGSGRKGLDLRLDFAR